MSWTIMESKDEINFSEINLLTESVGWGKLFIKQKKSGDMLWINRRM